MSHELELAAEEIAAATNELAERIGQVRGSRNAFDKIILADYALAALMRVLQAQQTLNQVIVRERGLSTLERG